MKKFSLLLLLIAPLIMTTSLYAMTNPFPDYVPAYLNDGSFVKAGTKLYLFHSGTEEVNNTINVNDVLTVYRNILLTSPWEAKMRARCGYYLHWEIIISKVR